MAAPSGVTEVAGEPPSPELPRAAHPASRLATPTAAAMRPSSACAQHALPAATGYVRYTYHHVQGGNERSPDASRPSGTS